MSSVPVSITWSGSTPTAIPDKAVVKLSDGQKSVQWTSGEAFSISVKSENIDAEFKGGQWVANSADFDAPQNVPYLISKPGQGGGHDPEIDVQT